MFECLDPVSVLQQRVEFLDGISELATLCNWSDRDTQNLRDYVNEQLIHIDNTTLEVLKDTEEPEFTLDVWDMQMEDLRHWLSLILGIKIKYI